MKIIVLFISTLLATEVYANLVKKSKSGICHDINSTYYSRVKNFTAYSSIDDCLKSSGRLPKHNNAHFHPGTSSKKVRSGDSRDKFGKGWGEGSNPHDCLNTRQEILKKMSTSTIKTGLNKYTVDKGKWFAPYTGKTLYNASDIDIDHIVPLAFSWSHGADKWSQSKREKFANDKSNLVPVAASANRSKGAKPPWQWMPEDKKYHCQYLLRFTRVVKAYGLHLRKYEEKKLIALFKKGSYRMPKSLTYSHKKIDTL